MFENLLEDTLDSQEGDGSTSTLFWETLERVTAPLRLQSPLRPEPIRAAYTGDYSLLGNRADEKKLCQFFFEQVYHHLTEQGKNPIYDGSTFLGRIYKESWTRSSDNLERDISLIVHHAYQLMRRQERAYTLGKSASISTAQLENLKLSTGTRSLYYCREIYQDILLTYVDHSDGKQDYIPKYACKRGMWYTWDYPGSSWTFQYFQGYSLHAVSYDEFIFLPINTVKCLYEVISARLLICLACDIAAFDQNPLYPSTSDLIEMISSGDSVLIAGGDEAFEIIKRLEGIVIGTFIRKHDTHLITDPSSYLEGLTSDYIGSESAYGNFLRCVISTVERQPNFHCIFQIFGLFRIWGYPHVNTLAGINKVKGVAQKIKIIDRDMAQRIRYMAQEAIFMSYFKSNGHYPPCTVLATVEHTDSSIIQSVKRNLPLHRTDSRYSLKDWEFIIPHKIFEPRDVLSTIDLLQDKACSANLDETIATLRQKKCLPPSKSRRTLLKYLAEENLDCAALLERVDQEGFTQNELIIGVTPKEREVKYAPRLFSLMPLAMRTYFTATEHLLAEAVLPHFPEIGMGLSSLELKRILTAISSMQRSDRHVERVSVALNFDFERWNLNERGEALYPLFDLFDQLFGYKNVFKRTHEIFSKSIYYCADQYLLPDPEKMLRREDDSRSWCHHFGGMEGLRQKGWTIGTVLLIRYIERSFSINSRLLGQGDNQILLLDYVLTRYLGIKEEEYRFRERAATQLKLFLSNLHSAFDSVGLPIKLSESWSSEILFAYGKDTYVKGNRVSMALKRVSRMFFVSNELHPTFFHTVSSIFSSAESVAENDTSPRIALTCAIFELIEAFELYWRWSPLRGRGLWINEVDRMRLPQILRLSTGQVALKAVDSMLSCPIAIIETILLSSHDFGGYPVQNYFSLSVRGFSDPLSLSLGFCHAYLKHNPDISPLVRNFLMAHYSPLISAVPKPELCLSDPLGLNIEAPPSFVSRVKQFGMNILRSGIVRNRDVLFLQSCLDADLQPIVDMSLQCNLFLPRLLCILADNSAVGIADQIVSKFQNATSLQKAARTINKEGANSLERALGKLDLNTFMYFITVGCQATPKYKPFEPGVSLYDYIQKLRCDSFGVNNVAGVTCPLVLSYVDLFPVTTGYCARCATQPSEPFTSIRCHPTMLPRVLENNDLGPYRPYEGSTTLQKQSSFSPWRVTTKSSAFQCARKLASYRGWIIQPGTTLDLILEKAISALTNVPYSMISHSIAPVISSATHRLLDPRSHVTGYPGNLLESYSVVNISTNTMKELSLGNQDRPINYQSLICYSQTLPIILAMNKIVGHQNFHLHITNLANIPPLDDTQLNLNASDYDVNRFSMPSYPTCPLLFADLNLLKISYRPATTIRTRRWVNVVELPDLQKRDIFNYICAQMLFRSMRHYSDETKLGIPPDTQLAHLYYMISNPVKVLTRLVRMLAVVACGYQWANIIDKQNDYDREDIISNIWARTTAYIAALQLQSLLPPAGYMFLRHTRRVLSRRFPPSAVPRDNPISSWGACESIRRILLFIVNECKAQLLVPMMPFKYELLDDRPLLRDYTDNVIATILSYTELESTHDCQDLIRVSCRAVMRMYNQMSIFLDSDTVTFTLSNPNWIIHNLKCRNQRRLQVCVDAIMNAVPHYRLPLTTMILKQLASVEAIQFSDFTPSLAAGPTIVGTLRTIPYCREMQSRGRHIDLSESWLPQSETPQFKSCLRFIHIPTVAWQKWLELVMEVRDLKLERYSIAAVGDGCGGVAFLSKILIPNATVAYNSLQVSESGHILSHTESYPTALESFSMDTGAVLGCDLNTEGISDMTDDNWPYYFTQVLPDCNVVFCDANYGKELGRGRHIAKAIMRYCELAERRSNNRIRAIVMKSYLYGIYDLNCILQLFLDNFENVIIKQSVFSSAGSSECFVCAYVRSNGQMRIADDYFINYLSYSACEIAIRNGYILDEALERKSHEAVACLELLTGRLLKADEYTLLIAELSMQRPPSSISDAVRQLQLNLGASFTINHLHPTYSTNTRQSASYEKLQELAGLLILMCHYEAFGSLSRACKHVCVAHCDWIVFVSQLRHNRASELEWIVWFSPHNHLRGQVYDRLVAEQNLFGDWYVTMLVIEANYWHVGRSKKVFQQAGLLASELPRPVATNMITCTSVTFSGTLPDVGTLLAPSLYDQTFLPHTDWQLDFTRAG